MNLFAALAEKWGPLPAGLWIAGGAVALFWWARRPAVGSDMLPSGGLGEGQGTPEPCCQSCEQMTPNRILGLMPAGGLPAPLAPWVSLNGGVNHAAIAYPGELADAELA